MRDKENNFQMTINLMDLLGTEIITREDEDGGEEKGVFIPLDRNNLRVGFKNRVFLSFYVTPMKMTDSFGNSHYVKVKSTKKFVEKLLKMGYAGTPIIGRMRHDWGSEKKYRMYNNDDKFVETKVKISEYEQP